MATKKSSIPTKSKKTKKRTGLIIFKFILLTILSLCIFASVAAGGVILAIIKTAPEVNVNTITSFNETSTLFDDKGNFMDLVVTDESRTVIPFSQMPQDLRNAFVGIEDERFYDHNGIDLKRIFGVVYIDVISIMKGKKTLQGASTLTQQLLKRTMLSSDQTFSRKIQEMYMAVQLEKVMSKDEILTAYMNNIFLGGKAYGVEAAANQYFNKSAKDLTLIECAFIAGMPQSPSVNYPFSPSAKKDPSIYLNRTTTVLNSMLKNNKISPQQLSQALNDLNNKKLVFQQPSTNANKLNNEWFSLPVIESVKSDLKSQFNYTDTEINNLLIYGGLKIYTTMNKDLQDSSQKILDDDKNLGIKSVKDKNGIIQPQGAATIMDYKTGEVKVIIGGRGSQPARSFNRAALNGSKEVFRPAGSSIKPLTVYSASIDSGNATAATVVEDSPLPEEIGKKYPDGGKPWNPRNYETGEFSGYVNLRTAITHSINLVAIKLVDKIGLKTSYDYGQKFGLSLDEHDKSSISALSLGQLHHGTNTTTMAAAYGVFGNNGLYTKPILYRKVVDKNGKTILQNKVVTQKVISPQSSFIMYDLLKGPVSDEGTAPNARLDNVDVRGKTGTSGDKKDFWFSGLTPYYSGSVWLGNDIPTTYTNIYSSTSADLWNKIMFEANKGLKNKALPTPNGITSTAVCMDSGLLPNEFCSKDPRGNRVYTEYFADGTIPTDICDVHVSVKINKLTGKVASMFTPGFLTETRVYIKRNYTPSVYLGDEQYVLPKGVDDTKSTMPTTNNNGGTTNTAPSTGPDNEDLDNQASTNKNSQPTNSTTNGTKSTPGTQSTPSVNNKTNNNATTKKPN